MDCKKIQLLLIDYADKKLQDEEARLVQQHLLKCSACRQELDEILELLGMLSSYPQEKPGEELKARFLANLESEKKSIASAKKVSHPDHSHFTLQRGNRGYWFGRVAAAVVILVAGMGIGLLIHSYSSNRELAELKNEMREMKQFVMLAQLQHKSPSQRIQAVNYIEDQVAAPGQRFVEALMKTIENDDNTNVRMTAVNAISKYEDQIQVKDFLMGVLENESDPMMQIVLINSLTEMNESRAVNQFRKLMQDNESMDVV